MIRARCARFAGIDLGREPVPEETTICKFRHLPERHDPGSALSEPVPAYLAQHGLTLSRGAIVDATIIHAPRSTRNAARARDPAMRRTNKGNQRPFGMKAHTGGDSRSKVIHAVVATAANLAGATVPSDLLHGDGTRVWGDDQAYRGQRAVIGDASRRAMPRRRGAAAAGLARPRRPER